MPKIAPPNTPRLSSTALRKLSEPFNIDRIKHPLLLVGIRGYYSNTMGLPGTNDRGIYDDALFIDSPNGTVSYNANTDPSRFRPGYGNLQPTKGMAMLKPGLWLSYQFGIHKTYPALIQTGGIVTVMRDGHPDYEDTGFFGINIHKGGYKTTSSLGCQTVHPDQWPSFISLATSEAKRISALGFKKLIIPYLLLQQLKLP